MKNQIKKTTKSLYFSGHREMKFLSVKDFQAEKQTLKVMLAVLTVIILTGIVTALIYSHYDGNLSSGTFEETIYNGSGQLVHLNWSDMTNISYVKSGNYTSSVIDLGSTTGFVSIKWEGKGNCTNGSAYIDKLGGYCIDKYEANCMYANGTQCTPASAAATDIALTNGALANSSFNQTIWVYIDQTEARTACSRAGKHLCTDEEWLAAANMQGQFYNLATDLAVSPYYCVTGSSTYCSGQSPGGGSACKTGCYSGGCPSGCYSSEGVYDMTGNVWEWTNETVNVVNPDGVAGWKYANSTGGWQTSTGTATAIYGNDGTYFPTTTTGRAVLRGGRWGDGAYDGPFSAYLYFAPSNADSYLGFRCCSS